jgi:hypothetical protein
MGTSLVEEGTAEAGVYLADAGVVVEFAGMTPLKWKRMAELGFRW